MAHERTIQELVDKLVPDSWRDTHPFSDDMAVAHAELIRAGADSERRKSMSKWLSAHQPCLFGRDAAKRDRVEYCFLTDDDLVRGDRHVGACIAEARLQWRRRAQAGETSAFVVSVVSKLVSIAEPNQALFDFAQRLAELYLCRSVPANKIVHDELFLVASECRSWKVGVNFFGAQGDGRWWKDHRIPAGIALSMNSVGHLACVRRLQKEAPQTDQRYGLDAALMIAMQLIAGTTPGCDGRNTWLHSIADHPEQPNVECPVQLPKALEGLNRCEYGGLYHTDHTLPSVYFSPSERRPDVRKIENLDLTYLFHDSPANPDFHAMGQGLPQD